MLRIIKLLGCGIILLLANSCTKETKICDRFDGWKIISEGDRGITCEYQKIYIYKSSYYSVNSCCVCDFIPMAFDCNGEQLCAFEEDCMYRFLKKADYLFSAVEK